MIYLWVVSFLWAFSFGIIKDTLSGLDPFFVALVRLSLALLVFLPFLWRGVRHGQPVGRPDVWRLVAI
ncbi:MAG TPA: EamA family transporter, partial [Anaerolineaceae bacterium]|nr:EamA family transporter [Anaerolineaceae bacterium]